MKPKVGPQIYTVPAFKNVSLAAGVTLGTEAAPIIFQWPRDLFVTGILLLPQSGSAVDAAALSLRIQDETFQDIFGTGWTNTDADHSIPALAMQGLAGKRVFPLQRPVQSHDQWRLSILNSGADPIIIGALLFYFEEPATAPDANPGQQFPGFWS